ncbi:hypothetical protein TNCV_1924641 [Trichonephila clavipes]|nr:hypothetical protein TNCV_1924641 [Trichonephila clavipes]
MGCRVAKTVTKVVKLVVKSLTGSPNVRPTWLYSQDFFKFPLNCHYNLAGWRSWIVTGLSRSSLLVRSRPKSVDFNDTENRQRPCRMIIRYVKNP